MSDGLAGFSQALKGQGFVLARGDRRGFVAVDHTGEAYAISRWVGVKAKAVMDKLGSPESLPSVEDAQAEAAAMVAGRLKVLRDLQQAKLKRFQKTYERRRANIEVRRQRAATTLSASQQNRLHAEDAIQAARIRKGLLGLLDHLTGRRRKMEALNRHERDTAAKRDVSERQAQAAKYGAEADKTEALSTERKAALTAVRDELTGDITWLQTPPKLKPSKPQNPKPRRRSRNRSGPEPEL